MGTQERTHRTSPLESELKKTSEKFWKKVFDQCALLTSHGRQQDAKRVRTLAMTFSDSFSTLGDSWLMIHGHLASPDGDGGTFWAHVFRKWNEVLLTEKISIPDHP